MSENLEKDNDLYPEILTVALGMQYALSTVIAIIYILIFIYSIKSMSLEIGDLSSSLYSSIYPLGKLLNLSEPWCPHM